jgi:DNA-binding CsgD family transcriptional regulator
MIESQGAGLTRGALDAVAAPALLVDGYRRVIEMTPTAERVLSSTSRLNVRARTIVASTRPQTAEIEAALASVLQRKRTEAAVVLRGGGEPPVSLAIQALPQTEWQLGFRPCAIVVLKGLVDEPGDLRQALRVEFGLTSSEAEIALSLAACMPRAQIADLRGTSLGTVRQQIKSIFAKLGVSREIEFMGLVGAFTRA